MNFNETLNKMEWVIRGLTDLQHDITLVPNKENTISIFDNGFERNTPIGKFKGNTLIKLEIPLKIENNKIRPIWKKFRIIRNIKK